MKKTTVIISASAALVVVVLAALFLKLKINTFADYNNDAVLGSPNPPKSTYTAKIFVTGPEDSDSLLYIHDIKLKGIENIAHFNADENITGKLKCTYSSIQGACKLILVSEKGEVVTLFDSEKQKSGTTVEVPFFKGENTIRLVGKPVHLKEFTAKWVDIDHSKLSLVTVMV